MIFILGILVSQYVTHVQMSVSAPQSTISLTTPPVIKTGQSPSKNTPSTTKRITQKGSLLITSQGPTKLKSSKDAKSEIATVRTVAMGTLADSGASHIRLSSHPYSHLLSSRKDDISNKGLVASAGDNTLIVDVTSLATDPSHPSSITAPAVNVSPQSQGEIQADPSVFNDPSAKTQADDDEKTNHLLQTFNAAFHDIIKGEKYSTVADATSEMLIYFVLPSRGRKRANECKNQYCSYKIADNHLCKALSSLIIIFAASITSSLIIIFAASITRLAYYWRFYSIFVPLLYPDQYLKLSNESFSIRISI